MDSIAYSSKEFDHWYRVAAILKKFILRIIRLEFIDELTTTWREFKSYDQDEELVAMVDLYRQKYMLQGVKIIINVLPVIMIIGCVFLVFKLDLSDRSNVIFIIQRPAFVIVMAIMDAFAHKHPIILNNLLPVFLLMMGTILIKENLSYSELRMYDLWIPYQ